MPWSNPQSSLMTVCVLTAANLLLLVVEASHLHHEEDLPDIPLCPSYCIRL